MIIVSDTSPLNYLLLINAVEILPSLFHDVYVPPEVMAEFKSQNAPEIVRSWAAAPPKWLIIRSPARIDSHPKLHDGEAKAISLAIELHADRILIDERWGRRIAVERGLQVVGILGVLDLAAEQKLIELPTVLDRLLQTTFRIDAQIVRQLLERDKQRK